MLHATQHLSLTQPHAAVEAWSTRHATRLRQCQRRRCPRSLLSERGTAEGVAEPPGERFSCPRPRCQVGANACRKGMDFSRQKRLAISICPYIYVHVKFPAGSRGCGIHTLHRSVPPCTNRCTCLTLPQRPPTLQGPPPPINTSSYKCI